MSENAPVNPDQRIDWYLDPDRKGAMIALCVYHRNDRILHGDKLRIPVFRPPPSEVCHDCDQKERRHENNDE